MKRDKGKDDMEATPPPDKKEPDADEPEKGDEDEGDDNPDTEDEEENDMSAETKDRDEAFKALVAELESNARPAAPGAVAPATPAAPATKPAPAEPTDMNKGATTQPEQVYVDGDELIEAMLKSTQANIATAVGASETKTHDRIDKLVTVEKKIVSTVHDMSKAVATQSEDIAELKKAVFGGRRGTLSVHEPIRNGAPNPVSAEEYEHQAQDIMAKAMLAVERTRDLPTDKKVPMHVPGMIDNALRSRTPLDQVPGLAPYLSRIRGMKLDA